MARKLFSLLISSFAVVLLMGAGVEQEPAVLLEEDGAVSTQTAAAQAAQSAQDAQQYSSGALGLLTNKGVVTFWRGTLEEYQALEEKDPDTLYLVEE